MIRNRIGTGKYHWKDYVVGRASIPGPAPRIRLMMSPDSEGLPRPVASKFKKLPTTRRAFSVSSTDLGWELADRLRRKIKNKSPEPVQPIG